MEKKTKQEWKDEVINFWTFLPWKIMNGKFGECVQLLGDVKIIFTHPKSKLPAVVSLQPERSENYNGFEYSHSDIKFGKRKTDGDGKQMHAQLRVHNSKISEMPSTIAAVEELIGKAAMQELRLQLKDELLEELQEEADRQLIKDATE